MIKAIIFDFGDIFINLNKTATLEELQKLGLKTWNSDLDNLNQQFEVGAIATENFLTGIQKHCNNPTLREVQSAWNAILSDFPQYRLDFLQTLAQQYPLYLLSNTDAIHIAQFEKTVGASFYTSFYECFQKVYFSYEMGLRKPNPEIYKVVLSEHNLKPEETLFVDDKKENTSSAKSLGIQVWNLKVGTDDVIELFQKNQL
jgi:glucose-1-phosphatase